VLSLIAGCSLQRCVLLGCFLSFEVDISAVVSRMENRSARLAQKDAPKSWTVPLLHSRMRPRTEPAGSWRHVTSKDTVEAPRTTQENK
jgi:hypothetical protein